MGDPPGIVGVCHRRPTGHSRSVLWVWIRLTPPPPPLQLPKASQELPRPEPSM